MNRLFEDVTERRGAAATAAGASSGAGREQEIEESDWIPAADVYEQESLYVVALDLPGIDRETLDISIDEDSLSIRGVRAAEEGEERRAERPRGRFMRRFSLPQSIEQGGITAEYKDGVLRLGLPKRRARPSQRVEIKVS